MMASRRRRRPPAPSDSIAHDPARSCRDSPQWLAVKDLFQARLDSSPAERERLLGHAGTAPAAVARKSPRCWRHRPRRVRRRRRCRLRRAAVRAGAGRGVCARAPFGAYLLRELGAAAWAWCGWPSAMTPSCASRWRSSACARSGDSPELRARFRRERAIPGAPGARPHRAPARWRRGCRGSGPGSPWSTSRASPSRAGGRAPPAAARPRDPVPRSADAVSYAHRNLVVHRDPQARQCAGGCPRPHQAAGLGIACCWQTRTKPAATAFGVQPLTPTHAAPEQLRGGSGVHGHRRSCPGRAAVRTVHGLLPYRADLARAPPSPRLVQSQEAERVSRAVAHGRGRDRPRRCPRRDPGRTAARPSRTSTSFPSPRPRCRRHATPAPMPRCGSAGPAGAAPLWPAAHAGACAAHGSSCAAIVSPWRASVVALTALGGLGATPGRRAWPCATLLPSAPCATSPPACLPPTTGPARPHRATARGAGRGRARRAGSQRPTRPARRAAVGPRRDLRLLGDGDRALRLLGNARDTLLRCPMHPDPDDWRGVAAPPRRSCRPAAPDAAARSSDAALALLRDRPLSDALRLANCCARASTRETDQPRRRAAAHRGRGDDPARAPTRRACPKPSPPWATCGACRRATRRPLRCTPRRSPGALRRSGRPGDRHAPARTGLGAAAD